MIQLDIEYSRKRNLWLDLRIVFMTIPALLGQMWDMRQAKKSAARPVSSEGVIPARAINH
jgi:lipopolysaccharide/colanic/teichoic acid biosynthesis glycosyltransferase